MNTGMNSNQFDNRMPGTMMNHTQPQQQLPSHLQMSQPNSNPNFINKLRPGIPAPMQHPGGGPMASSQSGVQQSLPASNNLGSMTNRSSTDTLATSVQMSMASAAVSMPTSSSMSLVRRQSLIAC